ncbi:MAG TPA: TIR domain-containing protein, partial [Leptolyngbyaceae cyanobacterium M65_K2018_010]|nr:TIR domain-containing protein [Leptolyngbyaceae cyanobacterium M65_K2018_010]
MHPSTLRPRKAVPKQLFYACQMPRLESAAQWREFGSMVPDQADVFIAYLPEDTATIRQLDEAILAEGFHPGVGDPASLLGIREDGQIEPGILACDAFLLFVGHGEVIPRDLEDELAQAQALNKLIILVASQPLATAGPNLESLTWQAINLDETIRVLKALARTVVHCLTYVRLQARALAWQNASTGTEKTRLLLSLGDIHATVAKVNWIETYLGPDFAITPTQRELIQASQLALGPRPGKGYVFGAAPDIFISYSSKNRDFVRVLCQALQEQGFRLWVDWENIPIAADWTEEVADGIVAAHTFIFVISSDSLLSEHCHWELDQARTYNRRLIPICCEAGFESERLEHLGLAKLNYCQFAPMEPNGKLDPEALDILLDRLRTDLEDAKQYNKLFTKAYEWDTKHRPETQLMALPEYKIYQHWLQTRQANNRHIQLKDLHPLQQDYLQASHQAILRQVARRRTQIVGGLSLAIATLILFTSLTISARIGELNALIESLTEQKGLNGLITALKASKQLQQTPLVGQRQDLKLRTVTALHAETLNVREINKFSSNQWGLFDVAFSPDGSRVISVGEDGAVRAWSVSGSRAYRLPEGLDKHRDTVVAVDYSSDGNFFASGGHDGQVNIWSCAYPAPSSQGFRTPQEQKTPAPGRLPQRSGKNSDPIPQSTCRWIETLPVRHGLPGRNRSSTQEPDRRIVRVGISPGSQYLASAGFDGQVLLWQRSRAPDQQIVFPDQPKAILRHNRRVYGLDFSQRNKL